MRIAYHLKQEKREISQNKRPNNFAIHLDNNCILSANLDELWSVSFHDNRSADRTQLFPANCEHCLVNSTFQLIFPCLFQSDVIVSN